MKLCKEINAVGATNEREMKLRIEFQYFLANDTLYPGSSESSLYNLYFYEIFCYAV